MTSSQVRRSLFIALAFLAPSTSFGQLDVITSGGFAAAYQELIPAFEKSSGITVRTTRGASQGSGPNTIARQLRRGVPARRDHVKGRSKRTRRRR